MFLRVTIRHRPLPMMRESDNLPRLHGINRDCIVCTTSRYSWDKGHCFQVAVPRYVRYGYLPPLSQYAIYTVDNVKVFP